MGATRSVGAAPEGPLVTGVGSLPFTDPDEAVAFVAAHSPQMPFWPQLPLRHAGEGMLRQTLGDTGALLVAEGSGVAVAPGRADDLAAWLTDADPAMGPAEAVGFGAFVRALHRGSLPGARMVKGHVTGPVTVSAFLDLDGRPVAEHPDLLTAVIGRIAARAAWQAHVLAATGLPVLLVIDEPAVGVPGLLGPDQMAAAMAGLVMVLAAIRTEGGTTGLHTCANGQIDLPDELDLDVVSLDLHSRAGVLPASVRSHWAAGGTLAAGLIPTFAEPGDLPEVGATLPLWHRAAMAAGDPLHLAERTIVTATCGLAGVSLAAAAASFEQAHVVADRLRHLGARLR